MIEFLFTCLVVIISIPLFFISLIIICVVTGSSADPDDNGLLKSKKQKEAWRQEKLKKLDFL